MKRTLLILIVGILMMVLAVGCQQQKGTKKETTAEVEKKEEVKKFGSIVVDKEKGEVTFNASVKKPEHPAGDDPTKLASPNALVNETKGGALPAAALVAEEGVTADLLVEAIKFLGLTPGQNIAKGEQGKTAKGDKVKIELEINGVRYLFDDVMKKGNPSASFDYVFLGNNEVQKQMGCGCLICGRSGPGTVLANSAYTTSDNAPIGPTLYKGLVDSGAKDGDMVKIVVSKRQ